jgi:uncharacterized membrane protein YccC
MRLKFIPRIGSTQRLGRWNGRQGTTWKSPIGVDFSKLSYSEGIRAGVAIAATVAVAQLTGWTPLMWGAVGAFWTCLVDPGGPVRGRLPIMLTFGFGGAILSAVASAAAPGGIPLVLPLTFVAILLAALLKIYGNAIGVLGTMFGTLLAVSLIRPEGSGPAEIGLYALGFLVGSLWTILFGLLVWTLHPYLPTRRSTAAVYRALAELAVDLRQLVLHPAPGKPAWEAHGRLRRRAVREAIEASRQAMLTALRSKGPVGDRPERQIIFLEAADQIFGAFIGFSDLLEAALEDEDRAEIFHRADWILRRVAPVLLRFADDVLEQSEHSQDRLRHSIEIAVHGILPHDEEEPHQPGVPIHEGETPIDRLAAVILDRMRAAAGIGHAGVIDPAKFRTPGGRRSLRERAFGPLKANMSLSSLPLRHALRVAATVTLAEAIALHWQLPFAYWLTVTTFVIMQPDFSGTWLRAVERVLGTVVGAALFALLGFWLHTPLGLTIAVFPLAVATLALRTVNYSLFVMCLTPLFVLVVDLGQSSAGTPAFALAAMRAGNSLLGGVIGILGGLLFWPSWEPARLPPQMVSALKAHAGFAEAVLTALLDGSPRSAIETARRQAGLASNNLEAAVQRALLEPHLERRRIDAALMVVAALRRIAGALTTISFEADCGDAETRRRIAALRGWIASAMAGLAEAAADGPAFLPLRPEVDEGSGTAVPALLRIVGQIELMAGAVSPQPAA